MKTRHSIHLFFAAALLVMMWSCKPDAVKPYEDRTTGTVSSIAGVWKGNMVIQRDNGAENKNFPYKSEDITAALQADQWKLTLNANGNAPSTFSIDYGTGMPFFSFNTGTWGVDNADKVSKVYLINGVDSIKLTMGSYQNLAASKLLLRQQKLLLGNPAITYEYTFTK